MFVPSITFVYNPHINFVFVCSSVSISLPAHNSHLQEYLIKGPQCFGRRSTSVTGVSVSGVGICLAWGTTPSSVSSSFLVFHVFTIHIPFSVWSFHLHNHYDQDLSVFPLGQWWSSSSSSSSWSVRPSFFLPLLSTTLFSQQIAHFIHMLLTRQCILLPPLKSLHLLLLNQALASSRPLLCLGSERDSSRGISNPINFKGFFYSCLVLLVGT